MEEELQKIESLACEEVCFAAQAGKIGAGGLIVMGASSSEVAGGVIGHASSPEIGAALARGLLAAGEKTGAAVAAQCCEHLNRALVMEKSEALRRGYEIVSAVPYPKAGGSLASAFYRMLREPVLVSEIRADAGVDIGGTLIGMHLKPVAVPVRAPFSKIGEANVTMAYTRPRLIGGERARYTLED